MSIVQGLDGNIYQTAVSLAEEWGKSMSSQAAGRIEVDPNSQLIRVPVFVQPARGQDLTGLTSSRVHNRGFGVLKYVHYTAKKSAP